MGPSCRTGFDKFVIPGKQCQFQPGGYARLYRRSPWCGSLRSGAKQVNGAQRENVRGADFFGVSAPRPAAEAAWSKRTAIPLRVCRFGAMKLALAVVSCG